MDNSCEQSVKLLVAQTFSNRYVATEKLGKGGMGSVYKIQTRDKEAIPFALKILSKKDYSNYVNIYSEAYSLRDLNHPGIPKIIEVREDKDYVFIIQEYIFGIDLKALVMKEGPIDENTIVFWMEELCEILEYCHSQEVIHRDIKPGNIMLSRDGHLKIIDFGLARNVVDLDGVDIKVVGTLSYTPPERYLRKSANIQTDIYGFGSTLYFLATGEIPMGMREDPILNMRKMMRNLENLVSPALFHIIRDCMAVEPQDRYLRFTEIMVDLQRYNDDNVYLTQKSKMIHWMQISSVLCGVLGCVLAVLGIISGYFLIIGIGLMLIASIFFTLYIYKKKYLFFEIPREEEKELLPYSQKEALRQQMRNRIMTQYNIMGDFDCSYVVNHYQMENETTLELARKRVKYQRIE